MENRFFVEAKSFIFSVLEGSFELRVAEKRKGFSGWIRLGSGCVAWLLSMVEEVLQNPGFENFVKSFREGSKVTIVRRGGNSSGQFIEVAVYAVGGWKGMIVFPEGRDGRSWGRVSGELRKVLVFCGTSVVSSSFSGVPVGKSVGKAAGVLSFVEAVGSPVIGEPLVQKAAVVWCEAEKIFSLDREREPFRQAVDCYDLERSSFGPLGKGLAVDCYALESSPNPLGKDLLACSEKRDAVDAAEAAGDVVVQELGIFRKLLDIFEKWLLWACAHRSHLVLISSDGLKRSMGRTKCCLGLGSMRFRARSRRVGCRSFSEKTRKSGLRRVDYFKKAKKCGLAPVHGSDAGMSSVPSGLGARRRKLWFFFSFSSGVKRAFLSLSSGFFCHRDSRGKVLYSVQFWSS
jgi:hypothetical protein